MFYKSYTSNLLTIHDFENTSFFSHLVHWKAYAIIFGQMWKDILGFALRSVRIVCIELIPSVIFNEVKSLRLCFDTDCTKMARFPFRVDGHSKVPLAFSNLKLKNRIVRVIRAALYDCRYYLNKKQNWTKNNQIKAGKS